MKLLLIEDEQDFIKKIADACAALNQKCAEGKEQVVLATPDSVKMKDEEFDSNSPIEEQLERHLLKTVTDNEIDLVLLDTDLSHDAKSLRTQTEYRKALQNIGVPVCRYRKGLADNAIQTLGRLKRISEEGSSAIWVPNDLMRGNVDRLVAWLIKVHNGFAALATHLAEKQDILKNTIPLGPPGILAELLERPSLRTDLLGYTAQNFIFFGGVERDDQRNRQRYVCQLGYWLHNHILTFPGPILNKTAAAAYCNLLPDSFRKPEVLKLAEECRYGGPFHELDDYYWKDALAKVLDALDGDIAKADSLKQLALTRIEAKAYDSAYYCVLSGEAIASGDAAPNPDWIPAGASLARIKSSVLDELGPMLNI